MHEQNEKYRQLEAIAQREFHLWENTTRATVADLFDEGFPEPLRETQHPHSPDSESGNLSRHAPEEPALILPGVFVEHAPAGSLIKHVPASHDTCEQAAQWLRQSEWMESGPKNSNGCLAYRRAIALGIGGRPVFISFDRFCAHLFPPEFETACDQGEHYWFETAELSELHPGSQAVSVCLLCGAFRPAGAPDDDIRTAIPRTLDWVIQRHRLMVEVPANAYSGPRNERFAHWLRDRGHAARVVDSIECALAEILYEENMDLSEAIRHRANHRLNDLWKQFLSDSAE